MNQQAQGPLKDLALHTLGWKSFQDLCAQICEEILGISVSIYREAQDGGQDAVFLSKSTSSGVSQVGTVQCKFTSKAQRHLRISDLATEEDNIRKLVSTGNAHSYIFITNMVVDAPVADAIRQKLFSLGVLEPYIFGKDEITLKIQESARLRALVPRVYGLGDLSIILDERRAEQTRAVLGHLMSTLSVYVPTAAHRGAVRVLGEHGIVLLLGAPATGKSTLAAILSTLAIDGNNHQGFQLDGPKELTSFWNPNESGRFYWIDDAFGSNQLRDDYIDDWISIMNKVRAAISAGNRFVLTSRTHIWNAAKYKLATRNHHNLADGSAVIEVGSLSPEERSQILYNHLKNGNQPSVWKRKLKPYLTKISELPNLLPEIARRLGDKNFTGSVNIFPDDVIRFVAEPMEFLKETINELNDAQKAALAVVFLNRSRLSAVMTDTESTNFVADKYGVTTLEIGNALQELNGTFLTLKSDQTGNIITFRHPTIADALSDLLGQRPDLVELYIRGVRLETLLTEVVCADAPQIQDAIVVPESISDRLIARLLEVPDDPSLNTALFGYLSKRASDYVIREIVNSDSRILLREISHVWSVWGNPKIHTFARLHSMRLLPQELRLETADYIEEKLIDDLDVSFIDNEGILSLIPPNRLLQLSFKLYEKTFDRLPSLIEEAVERADLEITPEDNFEDFERFLEAIESTYSRSVEMEAKIDQIRDEINNAVRKVSEKKDSDDHVQWEWSADKVTPAKINTPTSSGRSIFSDVDE